MAREQHGTMNKMYQSVQEAEIILNDVKQLSGYTVKSKNLNEEFPPEGDNDTFAK